MMMCINIQKFEKFGRETKKDEQILVIVYFVAFFHNHIFDLALFDCTVSKY